MLRHERHEKRRRSPAPAPVMPVRAQHDTTTSTSNTSDANTHNLDASCCAFPLLDIDYPAPRCRRDSSGLLRPSEDNPNRRIRATSPCPSLKRTKRSASYGCLRPGDVASASMSFLPRRNNLQLPSFESLGIAIPAPPDNNNNKIQGPPPHKHEEEEEGEEGQEEPPSLVTDDVSSLPSSTSPSDAPSSSAPAFAKSHSSSSSLPVTPPEYDDSSVPWNAAAARSRSSASVTTPPPLASDEPQQTPTPVNGSGDPDGLTPNHVEPEMEMEMQEDPESWLRNAFTTAVSSLPISTKPGESVQLISQTLPCPPSSGSSQPVTPPASAFASIVQAIQRRLQPGQSPYINIIHAVPPKFSLSNLPTSPPSTPNLLSPGDDYFNLTVFSSATPVSSYPPLPDLAGTPLPSSSSSSSPPYVPAPIVPPYSVHVSVVERYLPPPTAREYQDMLSPSRPSVLVDRLLELSPNDGTLVLVYPTKQGAQSFVQHYLSPILDPLLRQLVVVKSLSADTGMALGQMTTVSEMDDFETMAGRIEHLCDDLNAAGGRASRSSGNLSAPPPASRFRLGYASKGHMRVDRSLWTEWHIQQDSPRARTVLRDHWCNRVRPRSHDGKSTGTSGPTTDSEASILRELFDGFRQRSYSARDEPAEPLELGVFVIRRSQ